MATEISVEDRFRIQDVLRSYVWANDSGSVEGVVAAFTPDGIVQPATGERIPVRRWASETFAQPGRRGRQHWVQHITFEGTANGVAVRSYWKVVQGLASTNTRTLNAMGFYDDFCVKFDGRWLIKEKQQTSHAPRPWPWRCRSDAYDFSRRRRWSAEESGVAAAMRQLAQNSALLARGIGTRP